MTCEAAATLPAVHARRGTHAEDMDEKKMLRNQPPL